MNIFIKDLENVVFSFWKLELGYEAYYISNDLYGIFVEKDFKKIRLSIHENETEDTIPKYYKFATDCTPEEFKNKEILKQKLYDLLYQARFIIVKMLYKDIIQYCKFIKTSYKYIHQLNKNDKNSDNWFKGL